MSHSRRAGCPFLLKASTRVQVGQERPPWILTAIVRHHNHEVAMEPEACPEHRRLNSGQMAEVDTLVKSGVALRQILELMRSQSVAVHANIQTIYNAKQELIQEQLNGRTPIQALLGFLEESNWVHKVSTDSEGTIKGLFCAHPGSIKLVQTFHQVVFIDATYKTNKYRYPLLHACGMAATNQSFSIGLVFMENETEEDYDWAVQQLK